MDGTRNSVEGIDKEDQFVRKEEKILSFNRGIDSGYGLSKRCDPFRGLFHYISDIPLYPTLSLNFSHRETSLCFDPSICQA